MLKAADARVAPRAARFLERLVDPAENLTVFVPVNTALNASEVLGSTLSWSVIYSSTDRQCTVVLVFVIPDVMDVASFDDDSELVISFHSLLPLHQCLTK